jgi:hypothetical protein
LGRGAAGFACAGAPRRAGAAGEDKSGIERGGVGGANGECARGAVMSANARPPTYGHDGQAAAARASARVRARSRGDHREEAPRGAARARGWSQRGDHAQGRVSNLGAVLGSRVRPFGRIQMDLGQDPLSKVAVHVMHSTLGYRTWLKRGLVWEIKVINRGSYQFVTGHSRDKRFKQFWRSCFPDLEK